jgi:lipopolysaccharide/colanic/teichoic acid biosynthesis glycosyltransferase
MVFGTIAFATLLEFMFYGAWFLVKQSHEIYDEPIKYKKPKPQHILPFIASVDKPVDIKRKKTIKNTIQNELGEEVYNYLDKYINLGVESTLIVSTTTRFNIDNQPPLFFNTIVNLKRVNDIRWINKFFEAVNNKLTKKGVFVCLAETKNLRKVRILRKFPPLLNYIYYSFDFVIKRIFPKFALTKGLYFFLTRGENRVITRAELLGRLYSCGFEVLDEEFIGGHLFVICRKVKSPAFDLEATYGPLIKLKRIGKDGKEIKVYKMRTMHPYAEYLQEYVYKKHNLEDGGKFKDDFRVSTLGRFMRRFWIDELPMLINLVKGELKIVGVRPLSSHYFSLYSKELQELRVKFKPGLIPPFYVDNPKTIDEIMASEMKYLKAYAKNPFITDVKYFFLAFYNILFKRYRSN